MKNIYIIGIDTGVKGGISVLKNNKLVKIYTMPLTSNKQVNPQGLYNILKFYKNSDCVIEKAQAMPKQGVVSMFNYGRQYGYIIGILTSLGFKITEVQPVKWKKYHNLIKTTKSDSIKKALDLYKDSKEFIWLKKHDGLAESLLIADYYLNFDN